MSEAKRGNVSITHLNACLETHVLLNAVWSSDSIALKYMNSLLIVILEQWCTLDGLIFASLRSNTHPHKQPGPVFVCNMRYLIHKLLFVSLNFILFLLSQIIQPKSLYKDHKPTVSLETGTSQKSNSEMSAGLGLINTQDLSSSLGLFSRWVCRQPME